MSFRKINIWGVSFIKILKKVGVTYPKKVFKNINKNI